MADSSMCVIIRCQPRMPFLPVIGVIFFNVVKDHQLFCEKLQSYCSHTMAASIMTTALGSTMEKTEGSKMSNF